MPLTCLRRYNHLRGVHCWAILCRAEKRLKLFCRLYCANSTHPQVLARLMETLFNRAVPCRAGLAPTVLGEWKKEAKLSAKAEALFACRKGFVTSAFFDSETENRLCQILTQAFSVSEDKLSCPCELFTCLEKKHLASCAGTNYHEALGIIKYWNREKSAINISSWEVIQETCGHTCGWHCNERCGLVRIHMMNSGIASSKLRYRSDLDAWEGLRGTESNETGARKKKKN